MRKLMACAAAFAICFILGAPGARAKEIPIPLKQVPKAVLDAAKAKLPGVAPSGARKEVLAGDLEGYKILFKQKGREVAVGVTPEGEVSSVAKAMAVRSLPPPVAKSAQEVVPVGRLVDAAELVEIEGGMEGKLLYLIHASAPGGTDRELKITPEGRIVWNMHWSR